jgi:hypothetical protein
VIGNHLPRQCGIATFTTHLSGALADASPGIDCFVVAMNDPGRQHAYPGRVRFEIAEGRRGVVPAGPPTISTSTASTWCPCSTSSASSAGAPAACCCRSCASCACRSSPTLHTILARPSLPQRRVIDEIAETSQRLVVMSSLGASTLADVYGIAPDRIDVIPHGIPAVPARLESKRRLGVEGRMVLLTFGLLSPTRASST